MIREEDLQEAIAEMQGQRNPNASTCIKLAAFYTILDHVREKNVEEPVSFTGYSYENRVGYESGSEFAQTIADLDMEDVWPVLDELMETLKVLQPKLYNGVIRKLDGLK